MEITNKPTAIIVDDEDNAIIVMKILIQKHCPNVDIIAMVNNSQAAIDAIKKYKPDIVFLDIEMPKLNGFQILEQVAEENFHLVFTTAYNQYAVKAFKYSAVDYLLKPIDHNELIAAVAKIDFQDKTKKERVATLSNNLHLIENKKKIETIALPHARGYLFQAVADIVYCEANNTYTTFYFKNKPALLITKPIGEIENILDIEMFFRLHRQYLVNIREIKELLRSDGGSVIMSTGQQLPISRNRKDDLFKFMGL